VEKRGSSARGGVVGQTLGADIREDRYAMMEGCTQKQH